MVMAAGSVISEPSNGPSVRIENHHAAGVLRPTTRRPVLVHNPDDADLLGTAAAALAVETGRVGEASSPEGVLDALGAIDVTEVKAAIEAAAAEVGRLSETHHVEADPSVYGGGLYI